MKKIDYGQQGELIIYNKYNSAKAVSIILIAFLVYKKHLTFFIKIDIVKVIMKQKESDTKWLIKKTNMVYILFMILKHLHIRTVHNALFFIVQ